MSRKEKDAILIVSTLLIISLGMLVLDYNFISVNMWSALKPTEIMRWSVLGGLVLGVTYYASRLIPEHPLLGFSWLKLIPALRRHAENMAIMPTYLFAPLAVAYMGLLIYVLPVIAFWEELMFRGRIDGWLSAIATTLIFALVHFLVGATVGGSLVLVIPGGFFALVYALQGDFAGGLIASTYLHVFYDVGAVILIGFIVLRQRRQTRLQAPVLSSDGA